MSTLVGTGPLVALALRLERVRLAVWVVLLGTLPGLLGLGFASLYDSEQARAELVGSITAAPALQALLGPVEGTSVGALVSWRVGTFGALLVGLMAAFTVLRHTRLAEETGRAELLGATVVGRHAQLAAAAVVAVGAGVAIALLAVVGLVAVGEDVTGSVALGAAWAGVAVLFAGLGAVLAQVTQGTRGARGLVGLLAGVAFALRMAADGGPDGAAWLGWLSPIGWASRVAAFGDERWWVLGLFVLGGTVALGVAGLLAARRDLGAGVVPPRPGPSAAAPSLGSAVGLARRLAGRGVVGWLVGVVALAVTWGVLADTMVGVMEDTPQLAEIIERFGGSAALTDAFFNAGFAIIGLVVAAFATSTVLRLRDEEVAGRAEPVLATATSRIAWAGPHLVLAVVGPAVLLAASGVAAWAAQAAVGGDLGASLGRTVGQALLQVPAVWVVTGLVVLLFGLVPRLSQAGWGVVVAALLLGQLGQVLQLPQWALDVSPFTHVPVSMDDVRTLPLVVLSAVAAALVATGAAGLRRRDVG